MNSIDRDIDWVRKLPDDYLVCRGVRHAWNPKRFSSLDPEERFHAPPDVEQVIKRTLTCLRCPTVRHDYFGRTERTGMFLRLGTRYDYPTDYQFKRVKSTKDRPEYVDYTMEMYRRYANR